jgi:hypothetical protein
MIALAILLHATPVNGEDREEAAWRAEKRRFDRNLERQKLAAENARMEAEEMEREAKKRRKEIFDATDLRPAVEAENKKKGSDTATEPDKELQATEQSQVHGPNSVMLSCSSTTCDGNWEGERASVPAFCAKCGNAWSGATGMAAF